MNYISPERILIHHKVTDKDGQVYKGFTGIFNNDPAYKISDFEKEYLDGYALAGYLTFFGTTFETFKRVKEFVK